jgi:hypothetical protein
MSKLRISEDLSLPLDWMTLSTVVYGSRGSGKTTFGSVCAEEVTKAGQRFCAIDLKGDWYGLKSTANGKDNGIPVVVFGGDHADVPLEESAGAFLGETVAGLSQSCILDFEHMSKGKQIRFLAPFFETLYHRNRDPLLLLLDEIQRYAPQKPMSPDETRCLGAVQDTVKLGRKHGLGLVSFTQRGAGLNKEVSELSDVLVAFRTPGPLDQERIKDWLDANATKQQRDEVMGQLSGLGTGTAVIASGHPELRIFGTYAIRRRETFDSSATPKIGKRRAEPKRLATPDLDELRQKMAGAIERQKADDPKELRRRIAELERELAKKVPAPAPQKVERVEVPVIQDKQLEKLSGLLAQAKEVAADINATSARAMAPKVLAANTGIRRIIPERPASIHAAAPKRASNGAVPSNGETKLGRCERAILVALAQHHPTRSSASRVAILAGYSVTSGGFNNSLSVLRSAGLIEGSGSAMAITDAGLAGFGGDIPALPSGEERLRYWQGRLGKCEAGILGVLAASYPDGLDKAVIAERAGYSDTSGGFNNSLSTLRTLELISGERGAPIRATPELLS